VDPFLEDWMRELVVGWAASVEKSTQATGTWHMRASGRVQSADVLIEVEPAEDFSVSIELSREQLATEGIHEYVKATIFGVLDVFLAERTPPLREVHLTILEVKVYPVGASMRAFRQAGRIAAGKIFPDRAM
jgi:hypothetical protein